MTGVAQAAVTADDVANYVDRLGAAAETDAIDLAVAALAERFPPLRDHTGPQHESTVDDLGHLVDFLCAGLLVDDAALFAEFVAWLGHILGTRGVPAASVKIVLDAFAAALYDFPRARAHVEAGRRAL